jgi:N-glycosylase/DNA lyase
MTNLSEMEAEIYKTILQIGRATRTSEVVREVNLDYRKAMNSILRLVQKGALDKAGKGLYQAKDVAYSIGRGNSVREPFSIDTNVPARIRQFIIAEATKNPQPKRLHIASKAGVSKLVLNQILIEEGLDLEAK